MQAFVPERSRLTLSKLRKAPLEISSCAARRSSPIGAHVMKAAIFRAKGQQRLRSVALIPVKALAAIGGSVSREDPHKP
jgi:hypothetical protein